MKQPGIACIMLMMGMLAGCACANKCVDCVDEVAEARPIISPFATTYECVNSPYPNTFRFQTHHPYGENITWYGGNC